MRARPFASAMSLAAVLVLGVGSAVADEIARAAITVDATAPEARVTGKLSYTATLQGGPRAEISLWWAPGVTVEQATADGRALGVAEAGERGGRRGWKITLPSPIPAGETRDIEVSWVVTARGMAGIAPGVETGRLLPGSGWFPSTSPELDERPAHSLDFRGVAGATGVAAGNATGNGSGWASPTAARPYVVWGPYRAESIEFAGRPAVAYRTPTDTGEVPRLDRLGRILESIEAGIGRDLAAEDFKLVDVGDGVAWGGLSTLFWDESATASIAAGGRDAWLHDRDLAGALAATQWTERFRFLGDQAAFLSRSLALYLGDVATITLDDSDDLIPTERIVIGSRKDDFLAGRAGGDLPLLGLPASGPRATWVLATRGALVAHMLAEACPSRSHFISFLRTFREHYENRDVDASVFSGDLSRAFPNQHTFLEPYFRTTELPNFVIKDHAPDTKPGVKDRYRVQIDNEGPVAGPVEIVTFTGKGQFLRSFRTFIDAGQTGGVTFRDAGRIARIEIDPRGATLGASRGASIVVEGGGEGPQEPLVPAFPIISGTSRPYEVQNFSLDLPSLKVRNFNGFVHWWQTYHGPSAATLVGEGDVEIVPDGELAAAFEAKMHRTSLKFAARDIFLRFPLDAWPQFEKQFGAEMESLTAEQEHRRRFSYEHSFPTYFFEESRAQVPPPGSVLATFEISGDERRAWVRWPQSDGRTTMRLWDHLRGTTIWEETR
ncbi:MAG: hypothetical protein R3B81_07565 [bacterium]